MKKIISKSFSVINSNTISLFNSKSNKFRENIEATQKMVNVDTKGTASFTIKKMTNEILPNIEKFVEKRLLEDFSNQLTPLEKEAIQDSYGIRRYKIDNSKGEASNKKDLEVNDSDGNIFYRKNPITNKSFNKLSYVDVGKIIVLSKFQFFTTFPVSSYGDMFNHFSIGKEIGLLLREEGIVLKNAFSYIKTPKERKPFLDSLKQQLLKNRNFDIHSLIKNNFLFYSIVHQYIAEKILDFINDHKDERIRFFFNHQDLFDGLISCLMDNLKNFNFAVSLLCFDKSSDQLIENTVMFFFKKYGTTSSINKKELAELDHRVTSKDLSTYKYWFQIQSILDKFTLLISKEILEEDFKNIENIEKPCFGKNSLSNSFDLIVDSERFICLDLESYYHESKLNEEKEYEEKQLALENYVPKIYNADKKFKPLEYKPYYKKSTIEVGDVVNKHFKFLGFNSGTILSGEPGNGKSGVLAFLHCWAKSNNWFVIPLYNGKKLTVEPLEELEDHPNGLIIQNASAKEILLDIKATNIEILSKITTFKNYGKCNIIGEYDGKISTMPSLWDPVREVFTDAWKVFNLFDDNLAFKNNPEYLKRISDYIPNPKNLLEVVNFGLQNEKFAINAIAEVMINLKYNKETKVMTLVDDYNFFFRSTNYFSYKYANFYRSKVPPFAMALVRLFMDFDGHLTYNGVKVCATSSSYYYRHNCEVKDFGFPEFQSTKLKNLGIQEIANLCDYFNDNGKLGKGNINYNEVLYYKNFSQGNIGEIMKCMRQNYQYIALPTYRNYLKRKAYGESLKNKNIESIKTQIEKSKLKNQRRIERINDLRNKYPTDDMYI